MTIRAMGRAIAGLCGLLVVCATTTSRADTLTEWAVPFEDSQPFKIATVGPDVFYLNNAYEQRIGRLEVELNQFTEWSLPYVTTSPSDLVHRADDGALFMTGANLLPTGDLPFGEIGQFDPSTQVLRRWMVTEPSSGPWAISIGQHGTINFRASDVPNNRAIIGRLDTTTGTITTWVVPDTIANQNAGEIASLPDGSLFFNVYGPEATVHVAILDPTTNVFTAWLPPSEPAYSITTDANGNVYFQEWQTSVIARLVPATGTLTEWLSPGFFNDDLLWASGRVFTGINSPTPGLVALNPDRPGRQSVLQPAVVQTVTPNTTVVTPSEMALSSRQALGQVTERGIRRRHHSGAFVGWEAPSGPRMLAAGMDAIYFAASTTNTIGRITP